MMRSANNRDGNTDTLLAPERSSAQVTPAGGQRKPRKATVSAASAPAAFSQNGTPEADAPAPQQLIRITEDPTERQVEEEAQQASRCSWLWRCFASFTRCCTKKVAMTADGSIHQTREDADHPGIYLAINLETGELLEADPNNPIVAIGSNARLNLLPAGLAFALTIFSYTNNMFACRSTEITAESHRVDVSDLNGLQQSIPAAHLRGFLDGPTTPLPAPGYWETNTAENMLSFFASIGGNIFLTGASLTRSFRLMAGQLFLMRQLCTTGGTPQERRSNRVEAGVLIASQPFILGLSCVAALPFYYLLQLMHSPELEQVFMDQINASGDFQGVTGADQFIAQLCRGLLFGSETVWNILSSTSFLGFAGMFYSATFGLVNKFLTHVKRVIIECRQSRHFGPSALKTLWFAANLAMITGFTNPRNTSPTTDLSSIFFYMKPLPTLVFGLTFPLLRRATEAFRLLTQRKQDDRLFQFFKNFINYTNVLGLLPLVVVALNQLSTSTTPEVIANISTAMATAATRHAAGASGGEVVLKGLMVSSVAIFASFISGILQGPVEHIFRLSSNVLSGGFRAIMRSIPGLRQAAWCQDYPWQEHPLRSLARLTVNMLHGPVIGVMYFTTFAGVQNAIEDARNAGLSDFWASFLIFGAVLGSLTFNLPEILNLYHKALIVPLEKRIVNTPGLRHLRAGTADEQAQQAARILQWVEVFSRPQTQLPAQVRMSVRSWLHLWSMTICSKRAGCTNTIESVASYLWTALCASGTYNLSYMLCRMFLAKTNYDPAKFDWFVECASQFGSFVCVYLLFDGMNLLGGKNHLLLEDATAAAPAGQPPADPDTDTGSLELTEVNGDNTESKLAAFVAQPAGDDEKEPDPSSGMSDADIDDVMDLFRTKEQGTTAAQTRPLSRRGRRSQRQHFASKANPDRKSGPGPAEHPNL